MDYMYPSIFFAYFLFLVLTVLTGFFFLRSLKHGDFGNDSEEPKFRMMRDEYEEEPDERE
jgi:hypothetical protein